MINVRALGDWPRGAVHAGFAPSSRVIIPEVEAGIERQWASASHRLGEKLFDGKMCRLESFRASPAKLELVISETSYRVFLGTNLMAAQLEDRHPGVLANPLGVSCNLVTSDGWLLLGRRNASVAYHPNRVHPFAGTLEPRRPMDVFAEAARELREELGMSEDQIEDIRCVGIIEDRTLRQPEIIFNVRARRTRVEVENGLDAAEHHACVAVRAEDNSVCEIMRDAALTPIAFGALALWRSAIKRRDAKD